MAKSYLSSPHSLNNRFEILKTSRTPTEQHHWVAPTMYLIYIPTPILYNFDWGFKYKQHITLGSQNIWTGIH